MHSHHAEKLPNRTSLPTSLLLSKEKYGRMSKPGYLKGPSLMHSFRRISKSGTCGEEILTTSHTDCAVSISAYAKAYRSPQTTPKKSSLSQGHISPPCTDTPNLAKSYDAQTMPVAQTTSRSCATKRKFDVKS